MIKVAGKLHEILYIPQGEHDWQISAVLVSIVKSEEKLTAGDWSSILINTLATWKDASLSGHTASQSIICISQIESHVLQQIIIWIAGDEAVRSTKIVDSCGFSVSRRINCHNAKYVISV